MSLFTSFDINASGLTAQRFRMDIISENIANANSTRNEDGDPYVRKVVTFAEKEHPSQFQKILNSRLRSYSGKGVKVTSVREDNETQMNIVYDPSHPDADEDGYVTYPNVNIVTEMTNLIDASNAYQANLTAFNASKNMASQGLTMGKS
ncbi:flagellar basal body rod protein FlgC [Butyrivibrio sp. MC2013]|uniref:flagellar basal body rod protein FlgC n=1 Tax=Butyrivibrio sp. MC2013 TaxID=1280686 RepID=UPI0003F7B31D|nr:flagellar basal body rod protein FlgC [Butyrivibrio sp. MC2013]